MPQHEHDDQPLADVFDPESVDVPEDASDEDRAKLIKDAHKAFEADKLTGADRAVHDAVRALIARGFTDDGGEGFVHENGSRIYIATE